MFLDLFVLLLTSYHGNEDKAPYTIPFIPPEFSFVTLNNILNPFFFILYILTPLLHQFLVTTGNRVR